MPARRSTGPNPVHPSTRFRLQLAKLADAPALGADASREACGFEARAGDSDVVFGVAVAQSEELQVVILLVVSSILGHPKDDRERSISA